MRVLSRLLRVVIATVISFTSMALIAQTPAAAAEGDTDSSYQGGQTSTAGWHVGELHNSGEDGIVDIEIDASGNVITGGWWNNNGSPNNYSWSLVRYTAGGGCTDALRFDGNCGVQQWFSAKADVMTEVMIDANGKYVMVGYADANAGTDYDCVVYRTHSTNDWKNTAADFGDGVDTSFSGDGKFVAQFSSTKHEWCRAGALDADGKIVVAGYLKNTNTDYDAIIGRINTDGTWDTSFSSDGKYQVSFDQDDVFQDIAIQTDGKIVAVGTSDYGHTEGDLLVARFTTAGALDTSFGGGDGWIRLDLSNQDNGFGVELQSNGKIVVVGSCGNTSDGAVARLTTAGALDTTFSGDGLICQDHGGGSEIFRDLVIQADGKIFAAGNSNVNTDFDVSVARYTTAGALDTTFSGDGLATYNGGSDGGGNWGEITWAATTASNGNILVAGTTFQQSDADTFSLQIVSTSAAPAVTMSANGAFQGDGNNSTIATHEDPNVSQVPGGYQAGDSMHVSHEKEWDFDVNGTDDHKFSLVLGAQPPTNVVLDFTIGSWVGDESHGTVNTTLGTDLVIKDSGGNTVTQATFTNGNWNTAQVFTVVPVQDNVIEGYENGAIIATVNDAASDDMYGIISVQKNVVIWDDDHNVSAGWDHVNGAVDGLSLKAFPSEVVMTDYMQRGEQYLVDPYDGQGLRWYCIDPTALANHGGDIGNYIRSLGAAGVWASQNWVGQNIDHDGNTSFWQAQFGNKNWVALDNMDFDAHQTDVQRYVWGSDGKLRWSDEAEVPNGETGTACTGDDRLYMGSAAKKEATVAALPADNITIRAVADNDPTVTAVTTSIGEGASAYWNIKLGAPWVVNETIALSTACSGVTFQPNSLTFTNGNYNTNQTVLVSIAQNYVDEGNQNCTMVMTGLGITPTFAFTIVDDDTVGFTLSKTTASVSEDATTDSFTIVLDTKPATDVDMSITSADTGEATVSPAEIAFTTSNWNTPQTITVTGVNDGAADGNISTVVTIAVIDAQSHDSYDGVVNQTVAVTTTDNDQAGITVTQSGGSTGVAESGSTDTFTVVLTAQPATDVVIDVTSGDTGEGTVDKAELTFTSSNWNTAQTVTVTGVNDDMDDGNITAAITLAVDDGNSHDSYDNVANVTVSFTNTDNDTAGITIVQSDGSTVVEESTSSTDTFTVVLDSQPVSGNVFVQVTSSDTTEATITTTNGLGSVQFTQANWDTPQTVTVTGVADDIDDGNVNTSITLSIIDGLSSNEYDPYPDQTLTTATTDDDDASFSVTPAATTVTEGGTITITIVLGAAPTSNVTIAISSSDTSELTVSSVTITFTPSNWSTNQDVTLTGVDDTDQDGTSSVNVTNSVTDAVSDDAYDPLGNQIVSFTVQDNEGATPPEIIDQDNDADGIYNWDEQPGCEMLADCDFDGLMDGNELAQCLKNPDCDDDDILDGAELWACMLMADCDGDGLTDINEQNVGCIQDPKCTSDPLDSDNDGIYDKDELAQCVTNPDCDGDGVGDASELLACILVADCDGDGVDDSSELASCIQNPNCGKSRLDSDRDGLTDSFEYTISILCVKDADCDDDGVMDGDEVLACILRADCDGDGASDKYEINKTCVQDPSCTPVGMSKEDKQVGELTDLFSRSPK